MPSPEKPWLRTEGETDKSWRAFRAYRDLPYKSSDHPEAPCDRSHRKVRELVYGDSSGTLRYIEEWSSKHEWVRRAEAYDEYLEEQARKAFERDRLADRERRIKTNKALRAKAIQALSEQAVATMTWPDIIRALKLANSENRTEYGDEPAQRLELTGADGGPIETTSQRDELVAQLQKELEEAAAEDETEEA